MTRLTIAPLAALALAACNQSSVSLTNATPEEVAKAEAAAGGTDLQTQPGQWETVAEVLALEVPGMPAEMQSMMKKSFGDGAKISTCVKPDQVREYDPTRSLEKAGSSCRYSNYSRSGGRIDSTLVCTGANGRPPMTIVTHGTYTATSFTGESESTMEGAPGGGTMHIRSRVTARRTGECTTTD